MLNILQPHPEPAARQVNLRNGDYPSGLRRRLTELQRLQLAGGNRAVQQLLDSDMARTPSGPGPKEGGPAAVVQRVIRSPKTIYNNNSALRHMGCEPTKDLEDAVADSGSHLIRSDSDLIKRSGGDATIPMLPPRRHLVGERHDQSEFKEVFEHWGRGGAHPTWGAAVASEGLTASDTVIALDTQAVQKDDPHFWGSMTPLDNTHAFLLSGLFNFRWVLRDIPNAVGDLADVAEGYDYAKKNNMQEKSACLKALWVKNGPKIVKLLTKIPDNYEEISGLVDSYQVACKRLPSSQNAPTPEQDALGRLKVEMQPRWLNLRSIPKALSIKPYSFYSSWGDTSSALRTRKAEIVQYIADLDFFRSLVLDVAAAAAPGLTEQQHQIAFRRASDQSDIAETATDSLIAGSDVREVFMADTINQLLVPAIVGIGQAHVDRLRGRVSDAAYHASRTDFERSIRL